MTNIEEIWKDVVGYEGLYKVSDQGNVKTLSRVVNSGLNTKTRITKSKSLKFGDTKKNYYQVALSNHGNIKTVLLHRLVIETFNPHNDTKKMSVNHINGNKKDNRLVNLEWCTPKENTQHAIKLGLLWSGSKKANSKLTETDIPIIKSRIINGDNRLEIAKDYKVDRSIIDRIFNGRMWRHVAFVILTLSIFSCGPAFHLRQSERHLRIAIEKGAKVTDESDTTRKEAFIQPPTIITETDTTYLPGDTVVIVKNNVETKIVVKAGKRIYVHTTVHPKPIKYVQTIYINKVRTIKAGKTQWEYWSFGIGFLIFGVVLGALLGRLLWR